MSKLLKVIAASIVFAGCSTTAFAGTQDTALQTQAVKVKTSTTVKYASTKKVVRLKTVLPQASQAATHSTRTVLFFNAQPTRSKVLKANATKTSTPNFFKK